MTTLYLTAAGLALVFLVGAALNMRGYRKDPRRRTSPRVGYGRRADDRMFS